MLPSSLYLTRGVDMAGLGTDWKGGLAATEHGKSAAECPAKGRFRMDRSPCLGRSRHSPRWRKAVSHQSVAVPGVTLNHSTSMWPAAALTL